VAISFHMLEHGGPMTKFEHMRGLFNSLKIRHTPKKHSKNSSGWEMAIAMHNVILKWIVLLVQQAKFISIICDEVHDNFGQLIFDFYPHLCYW
jgi:hypothetical protein